jgi:hypothetical protein
MRQRKFLLVLSSATCPLWPPDWDPPPLRWHLLLLVQGPDPSVSQHAFPGRRCRWTSFLQERAWVLPGVEEWYPQNASQLRPKRRYCQPWLPQLSLPECSRRVRRALLSLCVCILYRTCLGLPCQFSACWLHCTHAAQSHFWP